MSIESRDPRDDLNDLIDELSWEYVEPVTSLIRACVSRDPSFIDDLTAVVKGESGGVSRSPVVPLRPPQRERREWPETIRIKLAEDRSGLGRKGDRVLCRFIGTTGYSERGSFPSNTPKAEAAGLLNTWLLLCREREQPPYEFVMLEKVGSARLTAHDGEIVMRPTYGAFYLAMETQPCSGHDDWLDDKAFVAALERCGL